MSAPSRFDAMSFRAGLYTALFAWSITEVLLGGEQRDWVFYANLVLTAVFGVMAVWTATEIRKQRRAGASAHIDLDGVYAALRCTGCGKHLLWVENAHSLDRLSTARDRHECDAAEQAGGVDA
jgi:putative Ca2+/H+ antiporter (TMEM165/GDT1 family)